jgi:hypothetical protein
MQQFTANAFYYALSATLYAFFINAILTIIKVAGGVNE